MNVLNNVILARNRQLPDDDRMIETCRSIFKKTFTAVNVLNNVILARNRQLPDDDRMIETCRSIFKKVFKSFNIKLSECISCYAD